MRIPHVTAETTRTLQRRIARHTIEIVAGRALLHAAAVLALAELPSTVFAIDGDRIFLRSFGHDLPP
jgi:hypothetical protein